MNLTVLVPDVEISNPGTASLCVPKTTVQSGRRMKRIYGPPGRLVATYFERLEAAILTKLNRQQRARYLRGELSRAEFREIVGDEAKPEPKQEPAP